MRLCFVLVAVERQVVFFRGPDKASTVLAGRVLTWFPCLGRERSSAIVVAKWGSTVLTSRWMRCSMENTRLIERTWSLDPRKGPLANLEGIMRKPSEADLVLATFWEELSHRWLESSYSDKKVVIARSQHGFPGSWECYLMTLLFWKESLPGR